MNIVRVQRDNDGVRTIIHSIAVGVDSRDVFYLIMFEAPAAEWEKIEEKARVMLDHFLLGS